MKGNKKTYRTISSLVDDALMDVQEGASRKLQFTRWALKYAEEVYFDHVQSEVKTVKITMKPWKAIELPDDCVDWISVGIQCGEVVKTFVRDKYIALLHDEDENGQKVANEPCDSWDNLEDVPVEVGSMFPFYNLTHLGEDPGKLFGLRVKDNGLGYVQENTNGDICELQFAGDIPANSKIYLQYKGTPINPCSETLIHPFFSEYVVAGIHVERCRFSKDKSGLGDAKEELNRQWYRMLDLKWDLTDEDITEILRSGYGLYPKK